MLPIEFFIELGLAALALSVSMKLMLSSDELSLAKEKKLLAEVSNRCQASLEAARAQLDEMARDRPQPGVLDTSWIDVVGIPLPEWMKAGVNHGPNGMTMDPVKLAALIRRRDSGEFELQRRMAAERDKPLVIETPPMIDESLLCPRCGARVSSFDGVHAAPGGKICAYGNVSIDPARRPSIEDMTIGFDPIQKMMRERMISALSVPEPMIEPSIQEHLSTARAQMTLIRTLMTMGLPISPEFKVAPSEVHCPACGSLTLMGPDSAICEICDVKWGLLPSNPGMRSRR